MGSRSKQGYGHFSAGHSKIKRTHRFSWELHFGPIHEGMDVLHKCDNPPCCRPDHLFLGTDVENSRDMVRKGRHWVQQHPERVQRGSQSPNAKLTSADVQRMRELRGQEWTYAELADQFGITRRTAARAVTGTNWKTEETPAVHLRYARRRH